MDYTQDKCGTQQKNCVKSDFFEEECTKAVWSKTGWLQTDESRETKPITHFIEETETGNVQNGKKRPPKTV